MNGELENIVFKNYYHLMFFTKYRRGVFTEEMVERMSQIFTETMNQMDSE